MLRPLPVDAALGEIQEAANRARAAVVVAAPGAGKTTRIPPALLPTGRVLLLQPRRAAARAIAQRIADERGWRAGDQVGWHVRFERHFGPTTPLIVATEGILTARLQADPLLSDFTTVVIDEFHERSIHADLGLALIREAWRARHDLQVVVMSATLDAAPVSAFLGDCPVITVPGTLHPVAIDYAPGQALEEAAVDLLAGGAGDVLCFLPGAREIATAAARLSGRIATDADVCTLHGAMDASEQDRVLRGRERGRRRVILATNLAETSVTVDGVDAVVDSGLHKVARYDPARGIDSLLTERISADAADQRAGRAGRLGPGVVRRLWPQAERLRPHRDPDIHRIDLAGVVLDVLAWGGNLSSFEWFDPPREPAIAAAVALLDRLGAARGGTLTTLGRRMQRLPVHPRLARILLAGDAGSDLIRACAVLSERSFLPPRSATTSSDLLSALDDWQRLPVGVHRAAQEITALLRGPKTTDRRPPTGDAPAAAGLAVHMPLGPHHDDRPPVRTRTPSVSPADDLDRVARTDVRDTQFRRGLLAGYPDRVAQRRTAVGDARFKLATGTGAVLSADSGVRDAEYLIACDLRDPAHGDSQIRVASRIEREWLEPTSHAVVHDLDDSGRVRARRVAYYDALVLSEHAVPPDAVAAADLIAGAWLSAPRDETTLTLLRRLAFAGCQVDLAQLARAAASESQSVSEIRIERHLDRQVLQRLRTEAPESWTAPSGRSVPLDYLEDGSVGASVKLQELFGLPDAPRIGSRKEPLLLSLLAPNGRPIQRTSDLRSFWNRTYPEVRKELRGRYPKHPWPEDPWTALPTARAKPRPTR